MVYTVVMQDNITLIKARILYLRRAHYICMHYDRRASLVYPLVTRCNLIYNGIADMGEIMNV